MSADLSGVRFDARNDFSKVVQQQGRVMLDSDTNEQVDLDDRKRRAQAADLGSFGLSADIAGTAVIPRTTPDAFALTISGGALSLGRGRMYVDGMLAENHGTGTEELDPLLADVRGASATPYLTQPYLPHPPALPAAGRHLIYLEVRERELTYVERPDLVDPAIAVDTTARSQVIWQAKVHAPNAPGITCSTPDADIPAWAAVIAPSAARLTVGTVPVPPATNPCSLPPSGDYRGLENQTYRVEIHEGGAAGTARFKWSRDNAAVTIPVTEVSSPTRLRLASLGKDSNALGLATGQWVEVLDDDHELAGVPGEMRQITVHPEGRSISFVGGLVAADWPSAPADVAARHLRVRRWDGATGVTTVPNPAAPVELEHGITVTPTLAAVPGSPGFRTGEYWVFTARTATTSVELLSAAPPVGPHRHVARLGIIDGTTVVSSQCAPLWPPDCDCEDDCACTVCVSVADHVSGTLTIQDGLDLVAPTGGTVCLEVGTYPLKDPLTLGGAAGVRLRGQGPSTVITCPGDGLVVEQSAVTTVEDLRLVSSGKEGASPSTGAAPPAGIRLIGCAGTTLERLVLDVEGEAGGLGAGVALHDLAVTTRIRDLDVTAPVGVHAIGDLKLPLLVDDLHVSGGVLVCGTDGVLADQAVLWAHGSQVCDNRIDVQRDTGIRLDGVLEGTSSVRVTGNHVVSGGQGIVVATGMTVADNTVVGETRRDGQQDTAGVRLTVSGLPGGGPSSVTGNTVTGFGRAAVLMSSGEPVQVADNRASRCDFGIGILARGGGGDVSVHDNVVLDIAERGEGPLGIFGIVVAGAATVLVADNTVGRVGTEWRAGESIVGIGVVGCLTCRIATNEVFAVGPLSDDVLTVDYAVTGTVVGTISGNQSLHDLANDGLQAFGLRIQASGKLPSVAGFGLGAASGGKAVFATDDLLIVQSLHDHEPWVTVGDNTLTGGHSGAAMDATVRGTMLLSHNHCTAPDTVKGAVRLQAEAAAVTGNRVRGGKPSMQLGVPVERLTAVGNLTSAGILVPGGLLPQFVPLNLDGVS